MAFDFGKVKVAKKDDRLTDPVAIFQKNKGKITDGSINDLWLGQGDALRDWDANRDKNDVAVVLNTGAGKTLIGLLIAQSLVNETRGKVLYACGSIQLIEQTKEKAEGYGINVTTYYGGNYSNDFYHKGEAVCLTTYQAIFNGKSVFRRDDVDAIIFDDAHTAESMIKSNFSIEIDRDKNKFFYDEFTGLFRHYYDRVGKKGSFQELYEGFNKDVVILPPTEVKNNIAEIQRILVEYDINGTGGNIFAWDYLKNHLDLCAYFLSAGNIQIVPPFIPINTLPYFNNRIRRVYLTATMLGDDAFIRTFGRSLDYIVKPRTTAGECERLLLFPGQKFGFDEELVVSKNLIKNHKTLLLTPNRYRAKQWEDIGVSPDREQVVSAISDFKNSKEPEKLILSGRYDGIDLPGDACRYLVLDGLPSGTSLADKFFWSALKLTNTLRSIIACRVVQSLGRISRGMSDYGVVVVTDKSYVKWLLVPKNLAALPEFVQKQVLLGFQVTETANGIDELNSAVDTFLSRGEGWGNFYESFMDECEVEAADFDFEGLKEFAQIEAKFIKHYWERDYDKAVKCLNETLDKAYDFSGGLGAWYGLWIGYCCERLGDNTCEQLYKRAYGASKAMPKYIGADIDLTDRPITDQVANISNEFTFGGGANVLCPKRLQENLAPLDGTGSINQIEEALRYLGQIIGLESTRPDKDHNIGPDVLWICESKGLAIEAKTSKDEAVEYSKKYVGQLAQHVQWVGEEYDLDSLVPAFVGPVCSASNSASPSDEMVVANLSDFKSLADRLVAAYTDVAAAALPITLAPEKA
jgi:hypothetical protein